MKEVDILKNIITEKEKEIYTLKAFLGVFQNAGFEIKGFGLYEREFEKYMVKYLIEDEEFRKKVKPILTDIMVTTDSLKPIVKFIAETKEDDLTYDTIGTQLDNSELLNEIALLVEKDKQLIEDVVEINFKLFHLNYTLGQLSREFE